MELREAARGRWRGILPALGIPANVLDGNHHLCPLCGKKNFRFDDKDARGTFICTCGAGDGIRLVELTQGLDFKGAAELIKPLVNTAPIVEPKKERSSRDKMADIKRVWHEGRPVTLDDPVGRYLFKRLGLEVFPDVIRTASELPYRHDDGRVTYHHAMLAKVSDARGEGVNVHRTYLTADGDKIDFGDPRRMMPGDVPPGAAIRLMPIPDDEMGIGEGMETAWAAWRLHGLPTWSAINANMLIKWRPPEHIKRLVIYGDCDVSHTGQAAAHILARDILRQRRGTLDVDVKIPEALGTDWDDVHRDRGR